MGPRMARRRRPRRDPRRSATRSPTVTKVTAMASAHDLFRSGRDALLATATDYDRALATYEPPRPAAFNWALDWFDVVAATPGTAERTALRVIEDDGSERVGDLRADVGPLHRGGRVAARPRRRARPPGAADARQPGRAVGDHARLHEARRRADPRDDAADRGGHHRPGASGAASRTSSPGRRPRPRSSRCRATTAASSSAAACRAGPTTRRPGRADADGPLDLTLEQGVTRGDDTLLLYFTSGTTAKPKLVEHTHVSYPVGHLSTMYWIGLRPGDVHLNISSPGLGQARVELLLRARGTPRRRSSWSTRPGSTRRRLLETMAAAGATTFCAPPTVYRMLIQQDLRGVARPALAARDGRRRRAAEPRGDRPGPRRAGPHHPRRLRPDRDHAAGRQLARARRSCRGRWAGSCPATTWCCSTRRPVRSAPGREPRASCACACPGPAAARSG